MPLRQPGLLLLSCLLVPGLVAGETPGWMTREDMEALPPELRRPIAPWCSGTWYNPLFARPAETRDTVITARRTRLREDGPAELIGDVEIRQPDRRLLAEGAIFDQDSGDFTLQGDIRVEMPNLSFSARDVSGNTHDDSARLLDARYALFDLHARGSAAAIDHARNMTRITDGTYTTCPPDSRAWMISGADITLDHEEGWGVARNVVLRLQRVPVLWVPWLTFPIDDRRKTGLLFPTITSADEGGIDITQPIYLNLHPQYDAIVAPRHIHGRGNGLENRFRYLTRFGSGTLDYSWLHQDRMFDDGNRALGRWRHDATVERWWFNADVNYVSDDFYLKDLDNGLEVASTTYLPREARAHYVGRTWRFLARLQSWQIIDPLLADVDQPYRRLPQLQLSGDPTLYGPLEIDWLSDYTWFDRSADLPLDDITGHRLHLQPALTMRLENSWGYLQPRARFYHTRYMLEGVDTAPTDTPTRSLLGLNLDAGVVFERPTASANLVQTLEPRIFLNYVEHEDQADLPLFDADELTPSYDALFRENRFTGFDRIGDEQSATLGLGTRYLERDTGRERLHLRVAQKLHRRDRRVQVVGDVERRSTSPLISEATVAVGRHWYLEAFNHWNTAGNYRELNGLRIGYQRNETLFNVGYTDRPLETCTQFHAQNDVCAVSQGEVSGVLPIAGNWQLLGRWFYDFEERRSLETLAGVEYRNCCWRLRMLHVRELTDEDADGVLDADTTWMAQLMLTGLGGFGGRIDSLLERSIPGYRSHRP